MEGSCVIGVSSTNVVGTENREENLELALVDKCMDDCRDRSGICGQGYRAVGSRRCDIERNGIRERAIEFALRVEKFKRAEMRRAGIGIGSKDGGHARRQGREQGQGQE